MSRRYIPIISGALVLALIVSLVRSAEVSAAPLEGCTVAVKGDNATKIAWRLGCSSYLCLGLTNPNYVRAGQTYCTSELASTAPAPAPAPRQPASAPRAVPAPASGGYPEWLAASLNAGGTWWCVSTASGWKISTTSTGANLSTYADQWGVCNRYSSTTRIGGTDRFQPAPAVQNLPPSSSGQSVAPATGGGSGVSWDEGLRQTGGRVFATIADAVYAVAGFAGRNGVKVLVGSASAGGAIWLVRAVTAAGATVGAGAYIIGGLLVITTLVMAVWSAITGEEVPQTQSQELCFSRFSFFPTL